MSPESPEPDQQEYNLTPRTEAKYAKIDEDFQMLIRNQHNGSRVGIIIHLFYIDTLTHISLYTYNRSSCFVNYTGNGTVQLHATSDSTRQQLRGKHARIKSADGAHQHLSEAVVV